ncbi:hypothetical protein [Brevibacillus agri]|uniref:hypothetical protein n=1 Tax=Brevibacillus agri TaxID=51101 RepID=UPI0030F44631
MMSGMFFAMRSSISSLMRILLLHPFVHEETFLGKNTLQEVVFPMTYTNNNNNNQMQSQQQQQFLGAMSPAGAMFQPGFAGTNVQEVQHWNHGGHAQSIGTPTYGMASGGGASGAQSIFSPGFAGTNAQEVRQLNNSYQAPQQNYNQAQAYSQQQAYGQQQQGYGQNQALQSIMHQSGGYIPAQPAYQQSYGTGANSIFSPGFAGTNAQEVRQQNQPGYAGYTGQQHFAAQTSYPPALTGSIFSPGFANTNVQEVRQLNQGGYGMQANYNQPQQYQQHQPSVGLGAQAIFAPSFAGTNTQEVRQLNAPGQAAAPHTGSIFPGSY